MISPNISASALLRVHCFLTQWFALYGYAPSYREIAIGARVGDQRVGGYLASLKTQGRLTFTPRVPRSIVMTRRFANASNDELLLECRARTMTVTLPPIVAAPLAEVYSVETAIADEEAALLPRIA